MKVSKLSVKAKTGNQGIEWNAENKGGNVRNGMGMQVQGISVGMRGMSPIRHDKGRGSSWKYFCF